MAGEPVGPGAAAREAQEAAARAALDGAARELLGALLRRVRGATAALEGAGLERGATHAHSDRLAAAAAEVHEVGWLFGVLAAGLEADTLVQRVERGGLDAVLAWSRDAVRGAGREVELAVEAGLCLAAPTRVAPRVAFALALCCVRAAAALGPGATLRGALERGEDGWRLRLDARLDDESAAWLAALEGTALLRTERASEWHLPLAWLESARARAPASAPRAEGAGPPPGLDRSGAERRTEPRA